METYLTGIVDYLLTQSWQIAILTVAVAVITFALRNRSAHIRYLLWLIVLAKCLVPPLYTIPLRVLPQDMLAAWVSGSRPSEESRADTEGEELASATYEPLMSEVLAAPRADASPVHLARERADLIESQTPPAAFEEPSVARSSDASGAGKLTWAVARYLLALAWLIGMALYMAVNMVRSLRTSRWLRQVRKPLPARFQARTAEFFSTHGFRRLPKIWLAEDIAQPFVWGLVRGSVYLPVNFLTVHSAEQQRNVLGHELSHIVRLDAAVNLLQVMAQAIFWFHPLVWWANKKIRAEREKCCDERAVAGLNALPKVYSTAIIETLVSGPKSACPIPSLAIVGPASGLEERIRAILKPGKRFYKRPSVIVVCMVCLIGVLTIPMALVLTARADAKEEASDITAAERTDREKDSFIGSVQVVRIEEAKLTEKDGELTEGPRMLSRIIVYDTEGRMIKDGRFSPGGLLARANVYTYDEEGGKVSECEYASDRKLRRKVVHVYDRKGNPIEDSEYDSQGALVRKSVYSYDASGNLTQKAVLDRDGSLLGKTVCTYNDQGNRTSETEYDGKAQVKWDCSSTYDGEGNKRTETWHWHAGDPPSLFRRSSVASKARKIVLRFDTPGNMTEQILFAADGSVIQKSVHGYDDKGNLTKSVDYDAQGSVTFEASYEYDTEGKRSAMRQDFPGGHRSEVAYVYNDKGDMIGEKHCDTFDKKGLSVESKVAYGYDYDPTGNWTKKTQSWSAAMGSSQLRPEPRLTKTTYRTLAYEIDSPQAEQLQAELPKLESVLATSQQELLIEVGLYGDSSYRDGLCFFDKSGATLPKSVHYAIRCTRGKSGTETRLAGGLHDPSGRIVHSLAGVSTDSTGLFRSSYEFQADDQPGVWLLKVGSEESSDSGMSVARPFHLYTGSGVSAYKMDLDRTSFREESILENKHLIAAFGNAKMSNRVLLYLYQKDTKTTYTFGRTNIGRFDYMYNRFHGFGEVTSDQSVQRVFSCYLDREAENARIASLALKVGLVYPQNEISHGACKRLSIWEKKGPSDYERVWVHTPDTIVAADHTIGDADNDGNNEIVWVTSSSPTAPAGGKIYVVEHVSDGYQVEWTSGPILSYQPRVVIADVDSDGLNEIVVAGGKNGDLHVFEHNGTGYESVACKKHPGAIQTLAVGDFDKDGEDETVTFCNGNHLLYVYEYNGADYINTVQHGPSLKFNAEDMDSGDIDGDGFPEIAVCGIDLSAALAARFIVIGYSLGSFNTTYISEPLLVGSSRFAVANSCALGDPDNDGDLEVMVATDRLFLYESITLSEFTNTWTSPVFGHFLSHMVDIEDGDSDGLSEILFVKPTRGPGDPSMWGNKTGGAPFVELWTYDTPNSEESGDHVHGLDTDSDGYKTNLTAAITLPSEDADWLEYKVHKIDVDPHISGVFAILSGSLPSETTDDRYRVENGADDAVTNLKSNTWNDFTSSYCMIYDESHAGDPASNTVLAWVRIKESENVKFKDVGLWNDTNGNAASRIRYDVKNATAQDWFSWLLVFTKGGKDTLDRWTSTLKAGKAPPRSFTSFHVGTVSSPGLPRDTQAFRVSLAHDAVVKGGLPLLYPGCMVDVMVSFQFGEGPDAALERELREVFGHGFKPPCSAVSITALANTQVTGLKDSGDEVQIILLVTKKQAEALQLGVDHGKIDLKIVDIG